MSIEEKFKNRVVLSEVFSSETFKHLNLNGIDCIQETWEKYDEKWIWVTFCRNEVEGIAHDYLIKLFLNLNNNLVFEWIDDEGEDFTYLVFTLIEEDTKLSQPQTEGTISIDELLKPGKFYQESLKNLKNKKPKK
jgi:hypothetical protein